MFEGMAGTDSLRREQMMELHEHRSHVCVKSVIIKGFLRRAATLRLHPRSDPRPLTALLV